ncbi:ribokinase [Chelatococcus sp. SYSU_G07232]|uniref:Ribokinase n=1 Tax=Chelatococcus albus TaxID=3047466 RepID=A0ABT7AE39_9HYPH|nr:ribokinase [Chelatococcus sp. SYSU_G07232]MDJ1157656.1 ribokinase [Chelatococcus sp. SYSU_G07232]
MIVVFGSLNADLVTRVPRIPGPGETVLGPAYAVHPGGKGANQALAAARAGARVAMVGAVGHDGLAEAALSLLVAEGVDISGVARVDTPTGAAFISVDDRGENAIVVAAGANGAAKAAQLENLAFGEGDLLLLQREVPEAECLAAAEAAKARGTRVMLNLAPAGAPDPALLALLDILVMNEHEAALLAEALALDSEDPLAVAKHMDEERGIATIVTLGAQGVVGWTRGVRRAGPALPVAVVDTTAAGDAFCGAFAAALDRGFGFGGALHRGVAAGGLACTRAGAQPSLPRAAEIEAAVTAHFA